MPTLGRDPPAMVAGCAAGGEGGAVEGQNPALRALAGVICPARAAASTAPLADRRAQRRPLFRSAARRWPTSRSFSARRSPSLFALAGGDRRQCLARDAARGGARRRPRLRPGAAARRICRRPGARADDPDARSACAWRASTGGRLCVAALRWPAQGGGGARRPGAAPSQGTPRPRSRAFRGRVLPAFLPLAVVAPLLDRMQQLDAEILERPASLSDLETILRIGIARFREAPRRGCLIRRRGASSRRARPRNRAAPAARARACGPASWPCRAAACRPPRRPIAERREQAEIDVHRLEIARHRRRCMPARDVGEQRPMRRGRRRQRRLLARAPRPRRSGPPSARSRRTPHSLRSR